jgi:hypothetical protein
MPLFPGLMMLTFPQQQLTKLTSRIPGYIYLWLAIPIFGSASALTRKITEIGAEHFVDGHNPISYCCKSIEHDSSSGISGGVHSIETEQEIEGRMGFRGI